MLKIVRTKTLKMHLRLAHSSGFFAGVSAASREVKIEPEFLVVNQEARFKNWMNYNEPFGLTEE